MEMQLPLGVRAPRQVVMRVYSSDTGKTLLNDCRRLYVVELRELSGRLEQLASDLGPMIALLEKLLGK
jgi:hypothetical protein